VPSRGSWRRRRPATLAHIALVLIGEGRVVGCGQRHRRTIALARAGLTPAALSARRGLALINGTQPSTALLGLAVAGALVGSRRGHRRGAPASTGCRGPPRPFDPRPTRPAGGDAVGLGGQPAWLLEGSGITCRITPPGA
jgi:histidine ammonia-lyase